MVTLVVAQMGLMVLGLAMLSRRVAANGRANHDDHQPERDPLQSAPSKSLPGLGREEYLAVPMVPLPPSNPTTQQ